MRISVCIVTYNQEHHVDACIRSAATQVFDGKMEIVVGDDASRDDTPSRLDALAKEFPDRVRVIHRPENLGPGRNFAATIGECQGDYVAFLEGDNFWTNPHKLSRQAEMLDANPEMAFVFHRTRSLHEPAIPAEGEHTVPEQDFPSINRIDILFGASNPVALGSMLVRRPLLGELDTWTAGLKLGDWPLCMMLARHGTIGYIAEEMSRQRMHSGGVWTVLTPHLRALYILQMLNRVGALLEGSAQASAQACLENVRDWWARSIWDVPQEEFKTIRDAMTRIGQPALTEALSWAIIAQGRARLSWTEEQLKAHRVGWADEVAWLKGERDAALAGMSEMKGERDAALAGMSEMKGERDAALAMVSEMKARTLSGRLRRLRGKE